MLSDYCPYFQAYEGGQCTYTATGRSASPAGAPPLQAGEVRTSTSRCAVTTLRAIDAAERAVAGGCFATSCLGPGQLALVIVGSS